MKIPDNILKLIEMINKGKKLPPKKERIYSKDKLISLATSNLAFLNRISESEPIRSYLKEDRGIRVVEKFSEHLSNFSKHESLGGLWLMTVNKKNGLYYWHDADYPANRSDRDYTLIIEERLPSWTEQSLEALALVTKKDILSKIEAWLKLSVS